LPKNSNTLLKTAYQRAQNTPLFLHGALHLAANAQALAHCVPQVQACLHCACTHSILLTHAATLQQLSTAMDL
jgi:hypothetical protein